jgi:hypothetical protein
MFSGCSSLTTAYDIEATTVGGYSCESMFNGCTSLTTMPAVTATTLANHCYRYMFEKCTSLKSVKELPALTLQPYCYYGMFRVCYSLTSAPELPATELASYCYDGMFQSCTSLTSAPELPATTLGSSCYYQMFYGCSSLTSAPELPATKLAPSCYYQMFYGCKSLTTAPELPATTLIDSCYVGMFQSCTSLTSAPELPATELASYCYYQMFSSCTSLTKAPSILPAEVMKDYSCYYMFSGCKLLTTAPILAAKTLATYCYHYMFQGCTRLNYIKAMFLTEPSDEYTKNWVLGVAKTGTFVKSADATWENTFGISAIPSGWNVLTEGYEDNYMTIEALEDGLTAKLSLNACEYSTDAINWTSLEADTYTPSINTGEKLYFKGNITPVTNKGVGTFTITKQCNLKGNCNSMLFGDNAATNTSLSGKNSAFHYLFQNCSTIVSVSEDFLPATEISSNCYMNMFQNCTSLTNTPKLPATTLYQYCYANMFAGCTSLTTNIAFDSHNSSNKVTTAPWCCGYMFINCKSLTKGKTPYCVAGLAVNKTSNCFNSMFSGCSSMNLIYASFPISMRESACQNWVKDVASSGTFYTFNAIDWTSDSSNAGINGYPENWSVYTIM